MQSQIWIKLTFIYYNVLETGEISDNEPFYGETYKNRLDGLIVYNNSI